MRGMRANGCWGQCGKTAAKSILSNFKVFEERQQVKTEAYYRQENQEK